MIAVAEDRLTITIRDGSPEERLVYLQKALARTHLWYALNPDKRDDDHEYAATISLFMDEIIDIKKAL